MGNCFKKVPDKIDIDTKIDTEITTESTCCYEDSCPSSCCIFYIVRSKSQLDLKG